MSDDVSLSMGDFKERVKELVIPIQDEAEVTGYKFVVDYRSTAGVDCTYTVASDKLEGDIDE